MIRFNGSISSEPLRYLCPRSAVRGLACSNTRYAAVPLPPSAHNPAPQILAAHDATGNKRRYVQPRLMYADGSAFSSSELSREVHPLRPKPVVNPDGIEARRLIILSDANCKRPRLRDELNRISQLCGNELCDSTVHGSNSDAPIIIRARPTPMRSEGCVRPLRARGGPLGRFTSVNSEG